ncbi:zinc-binding alcohol dehydrogenase family protein [Starkeya sp. ORNL1]|uniref:quinone oxidoreductase family protein n=1 Tax=Starkeya sp. ORNL1 TaxID=2709380 RepID=UPI0014643E64|nr:zinc-binding alcohol dehydrogenase family protein [Starkeya sp. ORNL1]QJP14997.1 zinc-binding alcohol dehydrogenase family protein [Starkeya sp. ORNL1]
MRAVQFSRFGDPDVLEIVETPRPVPGRGEVLVRIHAAGVNFFETLMRRDRYAVTPELPMIPGVEVAGVVHEVGEGADFPAPGARVAVPLFAFGRGSGGYADYVAVDAKALVPLPDTLAFEDAAALLVQGLTALHLLRSAEVADKTVLIGAAAGGVGSLLVQLARRAGAGLVVAAAGSPAKLDLARSLGADIGVDYTEDDWPRRVREATDGRGVDLAFELVGGELTKPCVEALAPGGELVFGALGRFDLAPSDLETMFSRNQSLRGFALLPLLTPINVRADLADLFGLAVTGALRVVRGGDYRLDQAPEAHRALEQRRSSGKIILVP